MLLLRKGDVMNLSLLLLGLLISKTAFSQQQFINTTATIDYSIVGGAIAKYSGLTLIAGGSIDYLALNDASVLTMLNGNIGALSIEGAEQFTTIYDGSVGKITGNGILLDVDGGSIGNITINYGSNLTVHGGAIATINALNSRLVMSGGRIMGDITVDGGTITGGTVDGAINSSMYPLTISGGTFNEISGGPVNISGGTASSLRIIFGNSNVSGGKINYITNQNILTISGGTVSGEIDNYGYTTITGGNISGSFENVIFGQPRTLDVYGYSLVLSANGRLTGFLRDEGSINIAASDVSKIGNINLHNLPANSVSGTINFKELVAQAESQNVTFTFRSADGSPDVVQTLSVPPIGTFTFNNIGFKAGVLHIKPEHYLAANVSVDFRNGNVSGVKVKLEPCDANNDNSVDSTDFGILIGAYGSDGSIPGSGYDARADFNGDGVVDSTDFGLLIGNFNTVGAP